MLKILFILSIAVNIASAKADWLCTHPQLCQLAFDYFKLSNQRMPSLDKAIKVSSDPHEIEPTAKELKALYRTPYLIAGPKELHPWATPILDLRNKNKDLKSFSYEINPEFLKKYPASNGEALAHFWLYPDIKCEVFEKLQKWINDNAQIVECPYLKESQLLKNINLSMPVIVSHDAIVPMLLSKNINAISIKGSGHHEEPTPKQLKKVYQLLKTHQKVIWLVEDQIHFPTAIEQLWRKGDIIIHINTNIDFPSKTIDPLVDLASKLENL